MVEKPRIELGAVFLQGKPGYPDPSPLLVLDHGYDPCRPGTQPSRRPAESRMKLASPGRCEPCPSLTSGRPFEPQPTIAGQSAGQTLGGAVLVPARGFAPPRPFGHSLLKTARLLLRHAGKPWCAEWASNPHTVRSTRFERARSTSSRHLRVVGAGGGTRTHPSQGH